MLLTTITIYRMGLFIKCKKSCQSRIAKKPLSVEGIIPARLWNLQRKSWMDVIFGTQRYLWTLERVSQVLQLLHLLQLLYCSSSSARLQTWRHQLMISFSCPSLDTFATRSILTALNATIIMSQHDEGKPHLLPDWSQIRSEGKSP